MKQQAISQILLDIGLTEKEGTVYLALLDYESLKVAKLANIVDIHRVSLYEVLESLIHKGLVSKFKQGHATYYSALSPKQLVQYIEQEQAEVVEKMNQQKLKIEQILPQMESQRFSGTTKPKVQFFEGEKGVREAYEDTLSARELIMAYANVETMHRGLPNFFPKYYERRTAKKVAIRAIMPRNKMSEERASKDVKELRQSRFLPDGQTFSPEVNIYNNKVLIASWDEQMAVVIESKEYADLQRVIYENLWKNLPPVN